MFISAHTHVETAISASPMQAFVNKAKALGRTHFTYTDYGYMTGAFKSYKMAKDAGLGFIPGIEMMFLDKDCVSAKAVPKAKYFSITAYAHDKDAYHALAAVSSGKGSYFVAKTEDEYPIYTWKDLEELSKHNVSFVLSGATSLYYRVYSKDKEAAKSVAKRLKDLGKSVYVAIIAGDEKEAWSEVVSIRTKKGVSDLSLQTRIDTNAATNIPAKDVMAARHTHILAIYKNGLRVESKEPMEIKDKKISYKATKLSKNYTKDANLAHVSLAKEAGFGILASDYASMANKEDREVQVVRLEGRKPPGTFFMMSEVEYRECVAEHGLLQADIDAAIKGSKEWASTFNVELKYDWQLPTHPEPEKEMVRLFRKVGRLEKFKNDKVYMDRLKYELEVLRKNGVIDLLHYFFPIASYFDQCFDQGVLTGPARGSGGGSLLCYFMGITHIDPIKYDLPFERFFSLDRIKTRRLPDIDCDSSTRVVLVGEDGNSGWLFNTYGDKAAQISTRQNMRLKSAIKDVNRVKNDGTVEKEIEILSEKLPNPPQGVSDYDYLFGYKDTDGNVIKGLFETNKDLKEYAVQRPDEWETVKHAIGIARTVGRHASAFLIADRPIQETIPTMRVGGSLRTTQYEAKECEAAGMVKYDFLVVSQVEDVNACLKLINKKYGKKADTGYFYHNNELTYVWDLPQKDEKTKKLLEKGVDPSMFQIGTQSMAPYVRDIKPDCIEDFGVILAIVRPGPLDAVDENTGRSIANEYVARRNGQSYGSIKELNEVLPNTFGAIIFQEDITKVCTDIAGMSGPRAEILRDHMCKKRMKNLAEMKPEFVEGATKKISHELANKIWDMMVTFGNYSFNRSHSFGYSVITYATVFLQAHYPLEWWTAVLSNADQKEITEKFWKHVRHLIAPPDINISSDKMEIDYDKGLIRSKLSLVKGLSDDTAAKIMSQRPYKDIKDFVNKDVLKPAMTRKLIHVGIMDSLFPSKSTIEDKMQMFEDTLEEIKYEKAIAAGKKAKLKKGSVDPEFLSMSPLESYVLKKQILPSMPTDLTGLLTDISSDLDPQPGNRAIVKNSRGTYLFNGNMVEKAEKAELTRQVFYAAACYVISMKEFTYSGGTKKALKLLVDTDGYLREYVKWPNYDTGELEYPEGLKKESVAILLLERRPGKDPRIERILLQS